MLVSLVSRQRVQTHSPYYACWICSYRCLLSDSIKFSAKPCISTKPNKHFSSTASLYKHKASKSRSSQAKKDRNQKTNTPSGSARSAAQNGSRAIQKRPKEGWGASLRRFVSNVLGVEDARDGQNQGVAEGSKISSGPPRTTPEIQESSSKPRNMKNTFKHSGPKNDCNVQPKKQDSLARVEQKGSEISSKSSQKSGESTIRMERATLQRKLIDRLRNATLSQQAKSTAMVNLREGLLRGGNRKPRVRRTLAATKSSARLDCVRDDRGSGPRTGDGTTNFEQPAGGNSRSINIEGGDLLSIHDEVPRALQELMKESQKINAADAKLEGTNQAQSDGVQMNDVQTRDIPTGSRKSLSTSSKEPTMSKLAESETNQSKGKSAASKLFEKNSARRSNDVSKPLKPVKGGTALESLPAFKTIKEAILNEQSVVHAKKGAKPIKRAPTLKPPSIEKKGTRADDIQSVDAHSLRLVPVYKQQKPVPRLDYGLDRVLFNPGVYHLQDPRSRVFNFDPYLQSIMPVDEFDYNALKEWVTSSKDTTLSEVAREEKRKYTGSTSSMTSALAHFHYLLSQWREINPGKLSRDFPADLLTFTNLQRAPASIFLKWQDGVYAIDADKEFDTANILSMLGKSMEKLLTLPKESLERYRRSNSHQISEEERNEPETYHYTTMGDFLMRSQLDAHDPRVPGTGMFDLKTRAVVSIRHGVTQWEHGVGYEIRDRYGNFESYEREYYDMIRAAFLKYSLQVRMGRMDGIFVAFHNIERIFGFQYISLPEMDYALHGTEDTTLGDSEFKVSLDLLNRALDRGTAMFPEQTLRVHFETRPSQMPFMYIFVEPMQDSQMTQIQDTNKETIMNFERDVMGLTAKEEDQQIKLEEARKQKDLEWARVKAMVEASVEKDELNIPEARAVALRLIGDNEVLGLSEKEVAIEVESLLAVYYRCLEEEDEQKLPDDVDSVDRTCSDESEITEDNFLEEKAKTLSEDEDLVQEETNDSMQDYADSIATAATKLSESDAVTEDQAKKDIGSSTEDPNATEHEEENTSAESLDSESTTAQSSLGDEDLSSDASNKSTSPNQSEQLSPLLAMVLTVRNKVNGLYVERPNKLKKSDKWTVEYALAEVPTLSRAHVLYSACKTRRQKVYSYYSIENAAQEDEGQAGKGKPEFFGPNSEYVAMLRNLALKGRKWRKMIDEKDRAAGPVKVLGVKEVVVEREAGKDGNELKGEERV